MPKSLTNSRTRSSLRRTVASWGGMSPTNARPSAVEGGSLVGFAAMRGVVPPDLDHRAGVAGLKPSSMPQRRIGLVGCVKEKAGIARPAKDLYLSTLFLGRRAFVESACGEWWVLSAAHGLVHPDTELEPYDVTLKSAGRSERREWSARVLASVDAQVRPVAGDVFEIHAGAEYREFGLVQGLRQRGCVVEIPTEGLSIGRQLQFYKQAGARRL